MTIHVEQSDVQIRQEDIDRMRELIMCPLQKCYPADPPKRHPRTPHGLASLVMLNRQKTREWLREHSAGAV